jgi:signal peptidase I
MQPLPLFSKRKDRLHRWVGNVLAAIFIAFFLRTFLVAPYRAETDAAAPEIPRGSHFFVWKLTHDFEPGDLIAYRQGSWASVGRVVRNEDGNIWVNKNGDADALVPRKHIIGKVISIYWRASDSTQSTPGFYIGQSSFPYGDSIEITSVERSKNQMTVKGRYNLVSADSARLALHITSTNNSFAPEDPKQSVQISKWSGIFELTHSHVVPGLPHVNLYSPDGNPFAEIYFGTKAEALEEGKMDLHVPDASAETWSPPLAPGEKPDVQKIRDEIKTLMEQNNYEEALQRQIWYFNHSLQSGEVNPVRLSFGIMNWSELGRRYPKAKQALVEIRDRDVREFSEGRGYSELFLEIQSLDRELQDDGATLALFKTIYQQDKQLAGQCYGYAENLLIQNGDYDLCLKCIGDPQAHFESFRRGFEMQKESQERLAEVRKQFPPPATPLPRGFFTPPDLGQLATNHFVEQGCKLVEILVGTDHRADAEKIRDEAVSVLDDPRLKSAVTDAEKKIVK